MYVSTSDELLAQARSGDREAMDQIVQEWMGFANYMAKRYFLPYGTNDDMIQEALIGVYKAVRDYEPRHGEFQQFVYLCVRRQCLGAVRIATRHKHNIFNNAVRLEARISHEEIGGNPRSRGNFIPASDVSPEDLLLQKESFQEFLDALSSLTKIERHAVVGFAQGESYKRMAEDLGVDTKAIDNALTRGRKKLRKFYPGEGEGRAS